MRARRHRARRAGVRTRALPRRRTTRVWRKHRGDHRQVAQRDAARPLRVEHQREIEPAAIQRIERDPAVDLDLEPRGRIPRDDLRGTLVGFRMPAVMRDIVRQGYHFHLLSEDRQAGGHVDDEVIDHVEVEAQELHGLEILVPDAAAYQGADLVLLGPPAR